MPFIGSTEYTYAYATLPGVVTPNTGNVPAYYTQNSGYIMYQPGISATTYQFKTLANLSTATILRTYTGTPGGTWNYVHDKDLDSNIFYALPDTSPYSNVIKMTLAKGGTTVTTTSVGNKLAPGNEILGACYIPACMWNVSSAGAVAIGGFAAAGIWVQVFDNNKIISTVYKVPWLSEVYGVEVIPKQASGFSNHYAAAYTRTGRFKASWQVSLEQNASGWSNVVSSLFTQGTTGPNNGLGLIYYPPGKQIYSGDPAVGNRLAMTDTSSSNLYIWTVTEVLSTINYLDWTFLSKSAATAVNGGTPYHLSCNAYNTIV